MAGYWPSSFFACLWTLSSHRDRTNVVNKGFIKWLLVEFCLQDTAGSPERVASHCAIWFILPASGASHIIIIVITLTDHFR